MAQDQEPDGQVNQPTFYEGGSVGIDVDDTYYFITAEFHQNITQVRKGMVAHGSEDTLPGLQARLPTR